jgi:hypothetical protein
MISLKRMIVEGRYDSLVTKLSNRLLKIIKYSYSSVSDPNGMFAEQKIYYTSEADAPDIRDDSQQEKIWYEEISNEEIPLDFLLSLKVQWIDGIRGYDYGGDAYNETGRNGTDQPLIEIRFKIDPADYPQVLSKIAMDLRDVLRHEIEHTTQSGWNVKDSKYIRSDQALRKKIESGELPAARYFTLPKEAHAMIQGMYFKAKKAKIPLRQEIDEYLNRWIQEGAITEQDKQYILKHWRALLPKLGIRQEI